MFNSNIILINLRFSIFPVIFAKKIQLFIFSDFCRRWGVLLGIRGKWLLVSVHLESWEIVSQRTRARPNSRDSDDQFGRGCNVFVHEKRQRHVGRSHSKIGYRQTHPKHGHRRLFIWTLRLFDERCIYKRKLKIFT